MKIRSDLQKKMATRDLHGISGALKVICSSGFMAVIVYRFGRFAAGLPFILAVPCKIIYFILFYLVQTFCGISVQAYARIGPKFTILDSGCIFVVAEKIGSDFTVSSGVTVGNVRGSKRLPIIGDNVYLEPGAKVLGEIVVGNNVVIRANSLVLNNVPDNSIANGNPARISPLKAQASQPDAEYTRC